MNYLKLLMAIIVIIGCGQCAKTITGGNSATGVSTTGGTPPTIDISGITKNPSSIFGNPSRYSSPPYIVPNIEPPTPGNNTTSIPVSGIIVGGSDLLVVLDEASHGSGSFNDWRAVNGVADVASRQSSSTDYGELNLSRLTVISNYLAKDEKDDKTYVTRLTFARSNVSFAGGYYRERDSFYNGLNKFCDAFTAGLIRKDFTYVNTVQNTSDTYGGGLVTGKRNNVHAMDASFVGIYDFNAKWLSTNSADPRNGTYSDISEEYIGKMAISRRFADSVVYDRVDTREGDTWLPCCPPLKNEQGLPVGWAW